MSDPFTLTGPVKVELDSGTAGFLLDVDNASTNNITFKSNQTAGDVIVTLTNPTVGQCIAATSATAAQWKHPVDVRLLGVSLNAANYRAVNFIGNVEVTDTGGGVAQVKLLGTTTKQLSYYDSVGGQVRKRRPFASTYRPLRQ